MQTLTAKQDATTVLTMQNWFRLLFRPEGEGPRRKVFAADAFDLEGRGKFSFHECRRIEGWKGTGWYAATKRQPAPPEEDFLETSDLLPVVSERMKGLLENEGIGPIQYLPVRILNHARKPLARYYIANLLDAVPAMDLVASKFDRWPKYPRNAPLAGEIRHVYRLVLRGSVLQGHDIVRITNEFVYALVSPRVKALCDAAAVSGIWFEEVEVSNR